MATWHIRRLQPPHACLQACWLQTRHKALAQITLANAEAPKLNPAQLNGPLPARYGHNTLKCPHLHQLLLDAAHCVAWLHFQRGDLG